MTFQVSGKLIEKYDTEQISEKFRKREFVIEKVDQGQRMEFVDYIKFQCTQDRCAIIDNVNKGDTVTVHFNLRGRKWEKGGQVSYFTNLEAWRIEKEGGAGDNSAFIDRPSFDESDIPQASEADDDLPF